MPLPWCARTSRRRASVPPGRWPAAAPARWDDRIAAGSSRRPRLSIYSIYSSWRRARHTRRSPPAYRYDHPMFLKYFALPLLIIGIAVAYWFLSYEPAGTAMLGLFGVAMGV